MEHILDSYPFLIGTLYNLKGSILSWSNANLPLITTSDNDNDNNDNNDDKRVTRDVHVFSKEFNLINNNNNGNDSNSKDIVWFSTWQTVSALTEVFIQYMSSVVSWSVSKVKKAILGLFASSNNDNSAKDKNA